MSKRRYNEQQIGAILQRSGEIQSGLSPDPDSQGLTLEELQRVASEVGIEPHVVEQAALEVDSGAKGHTASAKVLDHTIDGPITDEQWEDMVISLRQYSGKPGTSTLQGSTREWTSDTDMGSLSLTAATRNGRTRFRMMGDNSSVSAVGWTMGLTFGFIGVLIMCAILGKKTGLDAWLITLLAAMASAFIVGLTALLTKSWQKKTNQALGQLFTTIIETANNTPPLSIERSVNIEQETTQPNRA